MFDDSVDAADHLARLPGAVVLVDGYNVSLEGWPSLALHAQRDRLVDALAGLAARTGCQPLVVFDGAEEGRGLPGESRPRGVQVRFTVPGVEADDALLSLVGEFPLDRPVTVVSSDRRVVAGSARRGAASLSASQLLDLLAG
nr:NYN domain-containing protein [Rhabdothermincola salaria]